MNLENRAAVIDTQHGHLRQTHQDLAHASRVLDQRRLQTFPDSHPAKLAATPPSNADPIPPSHPKRRFSDVVALLRNLNYRLLLWYWRPSWGMVAAVAPWSADLLTDLQKG